MDSISRIMVAPGDSGTGSHKYYREDQTMRKAILSLAIIVLFFFTTPHAFSDEIMLKAKDKEKDTWEMHSKTGEKIGTLKREKGIYRFFDNNQEFMGTILESKRLMPKGFHSRRTSISPEQAKFYLDLLEALKTIK